MNKPQWIIFFFFFFFGGVFSPLVEGKEPIFKKALPGYIFSFPEDHGAHPSFQTEWWYFTGHLEAENQKPFGFELTFFRIGNDDPSSIKNPSRWAVKELYLAHFAVSDIEQKKFFYVEKISREALGKAGAKTERLSVWIDDWSAEEKNGVLYLNAQQPPWEMKLKLSSEKPPVIQGKNGVSQKGKLPGEASHYYSLTRLTGEGTVTHRGEKMSVKGTAWMDHEFSTDSMPENLEGWDWFSVQLENQWELMIYQLRGPNGAVSPLSSGSLVNPEGKRIFLPFTDFRIQVLDRWKSQNSRGVYPIRWNLTIPKHHITLTVTPFFKEQELVTQESTRVTYWEGAVHIEGRFKEKPVTGKGYTEMTGYAEKLNLP